MLSLGGGAIYSTSTHQKLNIKSTTEAEFVAVDDIMPQVLWTMNFLEGQGYKVTDSVIYQDNQSGRGSGGTQTCHINNQYYFVIDRDGKGEVRIEYCPTEEMAADFFTNPLQGALFQKFGNWILNLNEDDILFYTGQRGDSLACF